MNSLRAAALKHGAGTPPLKARAWAQGVGMSAPIHLRDLDNQLDPEQVILDSGPIVFSDSTPVSGEAQVGLLSNGFWSFRGHVHNSGFLGFNYVCAAALDVKDPSGNPLAFANSGTIHGTADIGSRDDSWQQDGQNQVIADAWDRVKTSGLTARMHVSTDPIGVIETVLVGLFAGAVTLLTGSAVVNCQWKVVPVTDAHGGAGVDFVCQNTESSPDPSSNSINGSSNTG